MKLNSFFKAEIYANYIHKENVELVCRLDGQCVCYMDIE